MSDDHHATESEREIDQLVTAHLDNALDAESALRLHDLLRADVQARRLLLAASCQASALPRIALESGLARAAPAPRRRRPFGVRTASAASWLAAASLLLMAMWWWLAPTVVRALRIDGAAGLTIERAGQQRDGTNPWLRAGDRITATGGPARLSWTTEGTSIELASGAQALIETLGASKRLRLERGALSAVVAPQSATGGLTVATPFGSVDVVGTRFSVQVMERTSTVAVEHGSVRVSASRAGGMAPVTITAGYAVTTDGATVSVPGPISSLPSPSVLANTAAAGHLRLGAEDFRPSAGWEGDLIDGTIRGRPVASSAVTRITTPLGRPDGYSRFDQDLRCTLRLSVDRPTTLAVLLVCDHPDGGSAWVGNLQSERHIPAGEQELTITAADLRQVTAGTPPPAGSRVVAVAVMCWVPAADLRLHWIELSR